MPTLIIRNVPVDTIAGLQLLADQDDRSRESYIRQLLIEHAATAPALEPGNLTTVYNHGQYDVYRDGRLLGAFVFSDGHHGERPYSNSYGLSCYLPLDILGKNAWGSGPLCTTKQAAAEIIARMADMAELASKDNGRSTP